VKIHAQLEYGSGWFSRNETTRAHYYRKDGVVSLCGLGRRDVTAVHPADADQLRCRHCEIKKRGSR
jgi:hypothetical protein